MFELTSLLLPKDHTFPSSIHLFNTFQSLMQLKSHQVCSKCSTKQRGGEERRAKRFLFFFFFFCFSILIFSIFDFWFLILRNFYHNDHSLIHFISLSYFYYLFDSLIHLLRFWSFWFWSFLIFWIFVSFARFFFFWRFETNFLIFHFTPDQISNNSNPF